MNVWRVDNAANLLSLSGHSSAVTSVAFDAGETALASGNQVYRLMIDDTRHNFRTLVVFLPVTDRSMYTTNGTQGGSIKIFDLRTGKVARGLTGHLAGVTALAYHPNASQQLLLCGSADTALRVWDLRAKQCILQHKGHDATVTAARFSPDGRWAATGGMDGVLNVWEMARPGDIFTFRVDAAAASAGTAGMGGIKASIPAVTALEFHSHKSVLATATTDRAVRLWDLESFELLATSSPMHPGQTHAVRAMAFDASGRTLHTAMEKQWRALNAESLEVVAEAKTAWQKPAAVALAAGDDGAAPAEELLTACCNGHFASLYVTDVTGNGSSGSRFLPKQQPQEQPAAVAAAPAVVVKRPALATAPTLLPPPEEATRMPAPSTAPEPPTAATIAETEAPVPPAVALPAAVVRPQSGSSSRVKGGAGDKENRQQQPLAAQEPPRQQQQQRPSSAPAAVDKPLLPPAAAAEAALTPEEKLERAEKELVAAARLHRSTLTAALTARLETLQALGELWAKGDVVRTARMAARLHAGSAEDKGRLTALADFFRVVDFEAAADAGLTLELAAPLVPIAASLLGLDFENHVAVGLTMLGSLVGLYGVYVKEVLSTPAGGRVDLSREERVAHCQAFKEAVVAAQERLSRLATRSPAAKAVRGAVADFLG